MQQYEQIRELLKRVLAQWRTLRALHAVMRAGLTVSAVLAVTVAATQWTGRSPAALAAIGVAVVVFVTVALVWGFAPLRRVPGDLQVARYIEERAPGFDDRLATAVDAIISKRAAGAFVEPMLADAARRAGQVEADQIVPGDRVRDAWFRAGAVGLVLATLAFFSTGPARLAFDATLLSLFPGRITLQVAPGNVRVQAGSPLGINARLLGNRAHVVAQVEMGDGKRWRTVDMRTDEDGRFRFRFDSVTDSFKYRVIAGAVTSPTYSVTVAYAPRVSRIDLDYTYPASLGLKPRRERDSGDIYAPSGTSVRLHIHTDRPAPFGEMVLSSGEHVALAAVSQTELSVGLTIAGDNSYRVALAGADGLRSDGDTEYLIRVLEDRPPEVRILKPAADRSVTSLEHRRRGGVKTSPLPDFLIGAHTAVAGMTLLTRDARRYRAYFPKLRIIAP